VHQLIRPPVLVGPGEYRYGEEFEGPLPGKGEHWVSTGDAAVLKQERDDLAALSSCIEASPVADVLMEKEAARIHTKKKTLVAIQSEAASAGVPGCAFITARRLTDLARAKKCIETDTGRRINAILQGKLREQAITHHNIRDKARKQFQKLKHAKARAAFTKAATKKRLFVWNKEKKARAEQMMKCGSTFTLHELGDGNKNTQNKFSKTRIKCLDQVYLRCPKLPLPLEALWPSHRDAFCTMCPEWWGVSTGTRFLQKVNMLIANLGVHYHGHADVKAKQTLMVSAWLKEHCKKTDDPRAFDDFVYGLQAWLPKSTMNLPTG
jgi:hypothetical protein